MPEWTEVLQLEYGEKTKTNKTNKKKIVCDCPVGLFENRL